MLGSEPADPVVPQLRPPLLSTEDLGVVEPASQFGVRGTGYIGDDGSSSKKYNAGFSTRFSLGFSLGSGPRILDSPKSTT